MCPVQLLFSLAFPEHQSIVFPHNLNNTMIMLRLAIISLLLCYSAESFAPLARRQPWNSRNAASSAMTTTTRLNYKDQRYTTNEVLPIPNDFKLFLTQCSIQSFMFLLRSMRDPETVMWLEEFTEPAIVQKQDAILGVAILEDSRVVDDEETEEGEEESALEIFNQVGAEQDESKAKKAVASNDGANDNDAPDAKELAEITMLSMASMFRTLHVSQGAIIDTGKEKVCTDDDTAAHQDEECSPDSQEPRKFSTLLEYHGLAALNTTIFPTWDSYFEKLLERPTEYFIVESPSPHVPDYELDIDPASLCSRIVSVRDQISKEFVKDLQVISEMGGHTLDWYWESLKKKRNQEDQDSSDDEQPASLQRENLLFLELGPDESSSQGPSPLRKGNFDLLTLLTTQEAIHRVLDAPERQSGPEVVTNEYLRQFYLERVHWFRGPQHYGRADDFLEELLSRSPRMINVADGVMSLIDPHRIATLVLEARKQVALEWKELAAEAPKEHMEIQKMRLNRMMGVRKKKESEEPFQ